MCAVYPWASVVNERRPWRRGGEKGEEVRTATTTARSQASGEKVSRETMGPVHQSEFGRENFDAAFFPRRIFLSTTIHIQLYIIEFASSTQTLTGISLQFFLALFVRRTRNVYLFKTRSTLICMSHFLHSGRFRTLLEWRTYIRTYGNAAGGKCAHVFRKWRSF